jgi:hypothetical protein
MRIFIWSVAGFAAGLVAGYGLVLAGWLGYAHLARIADHDGGKLMDVAFFAAPAAGVAVGIVFSFALAFRAAWRLDQARPR